MNKNMILEINIKDKKISLILKSGRQVVDILEFVEDYNLSEKLLPAIDKLVKKNKLAPKDIRSVSVSTDTPESFTTSRIAQAVGKAWNFSQKH